MSMRKKNSIVKAMNDQKEFSLWNTDPVKCSKIQWWFELVYANKSFEFESN